MLHAFTPWTGTAGPSPSNLIPVLLLSLCLIGASLPGVALSDTQGDAAVEDASNEGAQVDLDRFEKQLAAVEKSLEDARRQAAELTAERDGMQSDLRVARRELTSASQERERLERTIAEMESKLTARESSLAKASAERDDLSERLARTELELERQAKELTEVVNKRDAVARQLSVAEGELAGVRQDLAAVNSQREQVERQLSASEQRSARVEQRASAVQADLEGVRAEVARLGGEAQQLARQNQRLEDSVASLQRDLQAQRGIADGLRSEIAALKAGLPPELGGTASLPQLQAAAADIAERMRSMHRTLQRQPDNTGLQAEYEAAAQRLRERQLLIAGETGATGLYRLRPEDTLAAVANRFLGDGNLWGRIYEVNRHILHNPDRLVAGLTLVLP